MKGFCHFPRFSLQLRELTRYRKTQIDARVAEIQRLEKVLQDAGIKLTSVASKVMTQSGRSMIEALANGERDPAKLAELAKGKMRPQVPALTEALTGHFGSHHAVACRRILAHLDFLDETIAALTEQIDARTTAFEAVYKSLLPVPGFDRLTIDVIIAETGADMTSFPTASDLASWTRVCGPNKAAAAVAHSRIELVWHLLSTGEVFKASATTTSRGAQTPSGTPAVSLPNSNSSATPSPSQLPPPSPHRRSQTPAGPNSGFA